MIKTIVFAGILLVCLIVLAVLADRYNTLAEWIGGLDNVDDLVDGCKELRKYGEYIENINKEITQYYNELSMDIMKIKSVDEVRGIIEKHNKYKDELNKKIKEYERR